jgi:hypothetical protein
MYLISFKGIQTHTRADVVLHILVHDMIKLVENFSISYMATLSQDTGGGNRLQQLKDVRENWRQSNRRGHGHYAKTPETSTMNNLSNSLIISSSKINDDISIPHLPVANWLNVAIGLVLSIKATREIPPVPSFKKTQLLVDILRFIKNWMSSSKRIKQTNKISSEQRQLLNTDFHTPSNIPTDINEQLFYILNKILVPIIARSIPVKIIHTCTSCKFIVENRREINYISINNTNSQFNLHHQLLNYFAGSISDRLCVKCHSYMSRQIQIIDCKNIITSSILS